MPELAEVFFYSNQWKPGTRNRVERVSLRAAARVFRRTSAALIRRLLTGSQLLQTQTHGKQILFSFTGNTWLTVHLGMTGELLARKTGSAPGPHEHLVLHQQKHDWVFRDPRMFGEIRIETSPSPPEWWANLPPQPPHPSFTESLVKRCFQRHKRAPVKAVLLHQDSFPGIGNWMADEILWRSRLHPARRCGTLLPREITTLYHFTLEVSRDALRVIGRNWGTPPDSWLFNHRWKDGGRCPKTGKPLVRETLSGRTTCWSPAWQPKRPVPNP